MYVYILQLKYGTWKSLNITVKLHSVILKLFYIFNRDS